MGNEDGVFRLPSGRPIRGRGLNRPVSMGAAPELGLYLLAREPAPIGWWDARWIKWRDFGLPVDRQLARELLYEAWERCPLERVEIACSGGRGRTGTALACLAVLDGVPAREAVAYVRLHYHPRAVETPWQRNYVQRFDVT